MKYDVSKRGFEIYTHSKSLCEHCGYKMLIGHGERVICTHCGHFIYKNKKIKFKYEMMKALKKLNSQ